MKALCEKYNLKCQLTEAGYNKNLDENLLSEVSMKKRVFVHRDDHYPKDWKLVLLGYYSDPITEKYRRSSLINKKKLLIPII